MINKWVKWKEFDVSQMTRWKRKEKENACDRLKHKKIFIDMEPELKRSTFKRIVNRKRRYLVIPKESLRRIWFLFEKERDHEKVAQSIRWHSVIHLRENSPCYHLNSNYQAFNEDRWRAFSEKIFSPWKKFHSMRIFVDHHDE